MPISALPAKDGLKKALRLLTDRGSAQAFARPPSVATLPVVARSETSVAPAQPQDVISIPFVETSDEDAACDAALREGQFFARQESWETAEARLRAADANRELSPGGAPIAELIAEGARADVVNAVEHGLSAGVALTDRILLEGVMSLERVRLELGRSPVLTVLVALAHLDIAAAFRRATRRPQPRQRRLLKARAEAHLARAEKLLAPVRDAASDSPFIAAAFCALHRSAAHAGDTRQIADDYLNLIRLDPRTPRPMRALGRDLARCGSTGLHALDGQARRVAAMTAADWGVAGYTWVYFDALAQDDAACLTVDVPLFLEGIDEILARGPDPHQINFLCAYLCVSLTSRPDALQEAKIIRAEIAGEAEALVRTHLREVYPTLWARASSGAGTSPQAGSMRLLAESGRRAALQAIADLFRDEIAAGKRLTFTATGLEVLPR